MEIKGKFNTAKVFTNVLEDSAIAQLQQLCDYEPFKDSKIRIMPDVHAGKGCTIGTTMTLKDKVVPNMVGVDIGCGMELVKIAEKDIDFEKLDDIAKRSIPSGQRIRKEKHEYADKIDLTPLRCYDKLDISRAYKSIGTLGGGNHFIEMNKDDDGNYYIVIHSGSRHLGLEVANYYQKQGFKAMCDRISTARKACIADLTAKGQEQDIESAVKVFDKQRSEIDVSMAYVSGQMFDDYIHDMRIVQQFAVLNRQAMMDVIISRMGFTVVEQFTTIHNYIDIDNMILRKGAVSAQKGEKLLIPINMRDGSLICEGLGNEDWNCSAPHGAGRLMSRMKALQTLSLENFKEEMRGIYSTSVVQKTLDESPMAYKTIDDIVNNIGPTCKILKRILPVYNFKATS